MATLEGLRSVFHSMHLHLPDEASLLKVIHVVEE